MTRPEPAPPTAQAELDRLAADARRDANWKRWGPYLAARQWGTVREDYSADGEAWASFPRDHARSRAYRWGEDGLLGFTDRECRLCFALALWNERDPILKERLFGLANAEGNHGEDVKEVYFYLDALPTYAYARALYRYPQAPFPYEALLAGNRERSKAEPEYELTETGIFADNAFFDILVEYAKAGPDDILIQLTVTNHAGVAAPLHLLPTLWFRNTWAWGCTHEGCTRKPRLYAEEPNRVHAVHETLGHFVLAAGETPAGQAAELLFTENETNTERLFGHPSAAPYVKDAFHDVVVLGKRSAAAPEARGTKAAAWYVLDIGPGQTETVRLRLFPTTESPTDPCGEAFGSVLRARQSESAAYAEYVLPPTETSEENRVAHQAAAGLLWSKQFYHYVVRDWLAGDPESPPPPEGRGRVRNGDWMHVFNRDVLSVPDKWEYPWFAAWDLAFHMVPLARLDAHFAKQQLILLLREWYTHPSGQLPAYEYDFSDVNPPVHAWACLRVYQMEAQAGRPDRDFLASAFQKLLLNFTWWVNRKDPEGKHIFGGGFLGLDNIGLFDRSKPLPGGGTLNQADGTAWMAFYCVTMLAIALELARQDPAYEDMASKFFEHFIAIVDALNALGGTGLWHEEDGFYYDQLKTQGEVLPLRVRSMVGLVPLFAVYVMDLENIQHLHGFRKRMDWFLRNRPDLAQTISFLCPDCPGASQEHMLLAIPSRERLERVLRAVLAEEEFLAPHGVRSLSRHHHEHPFCLTVGQQHHCLQYVPGDSDTWLFGGNSNWRGPVWFPMNYLLLEALEQYHHFYGDSLQLECPAGGGERLDLGAISQQLAQRLVSVFLPGPGGRRPCFADDPHLGQGPLWDPYLLFHEYFNGDSGAGHGANHQTGWTALVLECLARLSLPTRR